MIYAGGILIYVLIRETDDVFGYARQNDAESLLAAINTNKDLLYAKDEDVNEKKKSMIEKESNTFIRVYLFFIMQLTEATWI